MFLKRIVSAAATAAALLSLSAVVSTPAHATAPQPGEDRLITGDFNWHSFMNLTPDEVSAKLDEYHSRPTDIKVNSVSPLKLTVTMVADAGALKTNGYLWYYGQTRAQIDQIAADNDYRPISLQRYWTGEGWRYVTVMIPDTKPWSIFEGTGDQITASVGGGGDVRLAQLTASVGGSGTRTHTAIAVSNAGGYAWGWDDTMTAKQLSDRLKTPNTFLADLDPHPDGTFGAVFYGLNEKHWRLVNATSTYVIDQALQHGSRIVDLTPVLIGGQTRYSAIMVDNLVGTSAEVRDIFEGNVPSGSYGFRLAEAGGSVVAGLRANATFEPASAIKALFHLDLLRDHQGKHPGSTGPVNLGATNVTFRYLNDSNPNSPASTETGNCPDVMTHTATTDLNPAESRMLLASDNRMTAAVADLLGGPKAVVDRERPLVGLKDTVIKTELGCADVNTLNVSSLPDLARIYEAALQPGGALGDLYQNVFRANTHNESKGGDSVDPIGLCDLADLAALDLGITDQFKKDVFCAYLTGVFKDGGLSLGDKRWTTKAGMFTVPFKSGGEIQLRNYTYGYYFDDMTTDGVNDATLNGDMQKVGRQAQHAALKAVLRQAWLTW